MKEFKKIKFYEKKIRFYKKKSRFYKKKSMFLHKKNSFLTYPQLPLDMNYRKKFKENLLTLFGNIKENLLKLFGNIRENLLRRVTNSYLYWFNEVATRGVLPFSHVIFIFWCVKSHYFKFLWIYIGISFTISLCTDFVLADKKRTQRLSEFLKKNSSPELFQIFGNPGEAALLKLAGKILTNKTVAAVGSGVVVATGVDHALTHTGIYDSISYKVNTAAGMDSETALSRLPAERHSAVDSFFKQSPNDREVVRLKNELAKLKNLK